MPIVDFHNHYYPPEYLDALGPSGSALKISTDREGNPVVHYPGDYNVMVRGHRDIAYRQSVLDEHGVDTQVISLTTPGTHVETPAVQLLEGAEGGWRACVQPAKTVVVRRHVTDSRDGRRTDPAYHHVR